VTRRIADYVRRLEEAILGIDAHATPLVTDEDAIVGKEHLWPMSC
jgi:hypothetical protein